MKIECIENRLLIWQKKGVDVKRVKTETVKHYIYSLFLIIIALIDILVHSAWYAMRIVHLQQQQHDASYTISGYSKLNIRPKPDFIYGHRSPHPAALGGNPRKGRSDGERGKTFLFNIRNPQLNEKWQSSGSGSGYFGRILTLFLVTK